MLIKLEWLGYCTVKKNYDNMLSRFHLIPERHGQTDGQTDSIAISISRVSVLTLDKNRTAMIIWLNFTNSQHLVIIFGRERPYTILNSYTFLKTSLEPAV